MLCSLLSRRQKPGRDADQVRLLFLRPSHKIHLKYHLVQLKTMNVCVFVLVSYLWISKNNRSFDTPVKGPPQGPRLHIDIPRVQLLIEDKEGIKQIGERKRERETERVVVCVHVSVHERRIK